jgi:hypothetical protein
MLYVYYLQLNEKYKTEKQYCKNKILCNGRVTKRHLFYVSH